MIGVGVKQELCGQVCSQEMVDFSHGDTAPQRNKSWALRTHVLGFCKRSRSIDCGTIGYSCDFFAKKGTDPSRSGTRSLASVPMFRKISEQTVKAVSRFACHRTPHLFRLGVLFERYHESSCKRVSAPDESALILQTAYRLVEGMQELEGAGFGVLVALLSPLVSFALADGDAGRFCGGA
jgi:hypothetical protein